MSRWPAARAPAVAHSNGRCSRLPPHLCSGGCGDSVVASLGVTSCVAFMTTTEYSYGAFTSLMPSHLI